MSEHPKALGKYRVESVLGRGAMGIVYKARDPDIGRTVAIKVMLGHLQESGEGEALRQRFRREAQAAASCVHPNIVAVFDLGQEDGRDFIVMEYVHGEELKDVIRRGHRFSQAEALYIVAEVLRGLGAAHRQGVVHRDVKPGNIILLDSGGVKVADFGVAKTFQSDLTVTGLMVGTPSYMSPEGLRGEVVDARADLYSAGVVLLELLTGEKPTPQQVHLQSIGEYLEGVFRGEHGIGLSHGLRLALRMALAEDRDRRFPDANAFLRVLEGEQQSTGVEDTAVATLVASLASHHTVPTVGGPSSRLEQSVQLRPDLLQKLETELVTYAGPVARLLVKKASDTSLTAGALVERLGAHIRDPNQRARFLKRAKHCIATGHCGTDTGLHGVGRTSANATTRLAPLAQTMPPEQVTRLVHALTSHVGPLARHLVMQHAQNLYDLTELEERLAMTIPNAVGRETFLKQVRG